MRKIVLVIAAMLILTSMVPASLAQQDDIKPYTGLVGADSPLYGIKLFIQQLDESLCGNSTQKLQKQMMHADERLSEAQAMAAANNYAAMEAAINGYALKLGEVNQTMNLPDIGESQYYLVGPWLEMHRNQFAYMANNTTNTSQARNCWNNAYQYDLRFTNGRPYTYENGKVYASPQGQMKNGYSAPYGSQGAGSASPVATSNGSMGWPSGQQASQPYSHNYSYNYSYDYNNNCSNDLDHSYSYNETNLSPGPHQEANGKK